MTDGAIEFRNVVTYAAPSRAEGVAVDVGISLSLAEGTTTALLGRSGSGKTTLLRTVNALVKPLSGQVSVHGQDVASADLLALRRGIGYVIQETGLYPHMTIERNVAMPLELAGKPLVERIQRSHVLLESVGLDPTRFATRMPYQLSGGERQRAGVARALALDPSVLLMDEPFGALDPLTRAEMQTMLRELLSRLRITALIVTHDLQEAIFLAHRVILLERGEVVADLASYAVLESQIPFVQQYVHAARRFEAAR
jgi:osmoprotectant transport system ATP-binding protein